MVYFISYFVYFVLFTFYYLYPVLCLSSILKSVFIHVQKFGLGSLGEATVDKEADDVSLGHILIWFVNPLFATV